MTDFPQALLYGGGRGAFGRQGGVLASLRPDDLPAHSIKSVVVRNDFQLDAYEDVIMSITNQAGEDCRNVGRFAGLLAGLPTTVGGLTANRLCGSGLTAFGNDTMPQTADNIASYLSISRQDSDSVAAASQANFGRGRIGGIVAAVRRCGYRWQCLGDQRWGRRDCSGHPLGVSGAGFRSPRCVD